MKQRRKKRSDWKEKKAQRLMRLMKEIDARRARKKPQTIGKACAIIAGRLKKKPLQLGDGHTYSPAANTIMRHYADWRDYSRATKFYPGYVPGKKKVEDETVPYLLDKLIRKDRHTDAFAEVVEEWKAGHAIPGIGQLGRQLEGGGTKAFPVALHALVGHRYTKDELDEIRAIRKLRREMIRRDKSLRRKVHARLGFEDSRYLKGGYDD